MDDQHVSTEGFEPADSLQINDSDVLKLLADPFRSRILDLLRAEAQTAKQLAQTLNLSPKKLYYHLKLMEEKGLIRIVSTRVVSGIIEKSYRATAYLFLFDGDAFSSKGSDETQLPPGLQSVFASTMTQLEMSFGDGLIDFAENSPVSRQLLWNWGMTRLSKEQAASFYSRLQELILEFNSVEPMANAEEYYDFRLFTALFPVKAFLKAPKARTKEAK